MYPSDSCLGMDTPVLFSVKLLACDFTTVPYEGQFFSCSECVTDAGFLGIFSNSVSVTLAITAVVKCGALHAATSTP